VGSLGCRDLARRRGEGSRQLVSCRTCDHTDDTDQAASTGETAIQHEDR